MKSANLKSLALVVGLVATAASFEAAAAPVSVIVHPSNTAELDMQEVTRIFLGKSKSFPGGGSAIPVDQSEDSAARADFSNNVLKKSVSQLKAYWSKLVFTGKGSPPKEMGGDSDVIGLVASNPNLIGYVQQAPADGSVRVLMTIE